MAWISLDCLRNKIAYEIRISGRRGGWPRVSAVYELHRYGYYVAPFLAGAAAILGAMACDRLKLVVNANRAAR